MLKAHLVNRNTSENIMGMKARSLSELKEKIVTLFKEPNSLLIVAEGMNPFLFTDIDTIIEEELNMVFNIHKAVKELNEIGVTRVYGERKGLDELMDRLDPYTELISYGLIEDMRGRLYVEIRKLEEELN